jgi:hypothetical protein
MFEYKKGIGFSREQDKTYRALVQITAEEIALFENVSRLLAGHDGRGW